VFIRQPAKELFIGRLGERVRDHNSKRLARDLGELVVQLDDSLRLRDERFMSRSRIFGADFQCLFERFGARQSL
jgi:hypothetical protein